MPLVGDAAALLASLVAATELLDATQRLVGLVLGAGRDVAAAAGSAAAALPIAPLDALAHALPFAEPLGEPLRAAAGVLASHATRAATRAASVADERATVEALRAGRDALDAAIEGVRDAIGIALPRVPRTRQRALRQDALGRVASLIREAGLEEVDHDVHLATDRDGGEVLVTAPILSATAHVWLLESLYQRLELAIEGHELLSLERMAAQWQFRRWGGDARLRVPGDAFGRTVREQEYAFVERPTLTYDVPVVAALPDQDFHALVPPRQQALARGLTASRTGVFVVHGRTGDAVELEDVAAGTRVLVHEHNPDIAHAPGFMAIGRVIPLDDERWLRSPGMAFLSPGAPGQPEAFAHGIEMVRDELGAGLAIEALIATVVGGRRPTLPLPIKPAASKAQAGEILQALDGALREAGLVERVAKRRMPKELVRQLPKGARADSYSLDRDVSEWAAALARMAGGVVPR